MAGLRARPESRLRHLTAGRTAGLAATPVGQQAGAAPEVQQEPARIRRLAVVQLESPAVAPQRAGASAILRAATPARPVIPVAAAAARSSHRICCPGFRHSRNMGTSCVSAFLPRPMVSLIIARRCESAREHIKNIIKPGVVQHSVTYQETLSIHRSRPDASLCEGTHSDATQKTLENKGFRHSSLCVPTRSVTQPSHSDTCGGPAKAADKRSSEIQWNRLTPRRAMQ